MPKKSIEDKLKQLPTTPGVYFFKDVGGKIIYVGKAVNLKNRVRSYFQESRFKRSDTAYDFKTELLVEEVAELDWSDTASEIDALFLESEMIKRYMPKYNIDLRDDRHYQYVRIDIKSDHPTVTVVRRPMDDGAEYFGPFIQGVRQALKFLRRIFPYDVKAPTGKRESLDYHLGLSPGLEGGKTSLEDYRRNLKRMMRYLRGQRKQLVATLEKDMRAAAKSHEFERAAQLRNQVRGLKALDQQIIFGDKERFDISNDQALNGLEKLLGLKGVPRRIEGYDISHMSGTNNVASMVVFTDGVANKGEYRKFKMRLKGNDDFTHMHEVISRRFSARNVAKWAKPDLLLIDGGKGQLGAALRALEELAIEIPAIGLAKREEEIVIRTNSLSDAGTLPKEAFVRQSDQFKLVELPKSSHIVKLLQRIRDESHRFAVSYHSLLRSKKQTASVLDEVPGIGPATRKKLIKTFGSLKGVQQARKSELIEAVGEQRAQVLRRYLRRVVDPR